MTRACFRKNSKIFLDSLAFCQLCWARNLYTTEPCKRREKLTEISIPHITDFQLPEPHHVGIVVRDRDATIRHYQEIMGIASFFSYDAPMPRALMHGKPVPCELRVGFALLGNTVIELLQPLDRVSPHFHFLEEHGEGMHHLGFLVPNVDDILAKMQGKGLHLLLESAEPAAETKTVYVEGDGLSGVTLEFIQESPAVHAFFQQIDQAIGRKNLL
jgi:methylmalonyl-CoA/ethylmalonyl-CoA epimerase